MKYTLIKIFILVTLSFQGRAQTTMSFDSIANKSIELKNDEKGNLSKIKRNLYSFIGHGVDSLDIEIFSEDPVFGVLIVELVSKKENSHTYQDFLNRLLEIKKSEFYPRIRENSLLSKELEKLPINLDNWDNDKLLLIKLGVTEPLITEFYYYLKNDPNSKSFYKEALKDFRETYETENTVSHREIEEFFKNKGNIGYKDYIGKSKETNKPLLLYFTGYACVNCRKMEENLFSKKAIFDILKNEFIFVSLYVDDRKALSEEDWETSVFSNKVINTIGKKNSNLQVKKFKTNGQPHLVILSPDETIVESTMYVRDETVLMEFLNKGVNKN